MTGFWSSETMRRRFVVEQLVTPFDPSHIENCAYALSMGPQALITGEVDIRKGLDHGEPIKIPPGHFAQLLTEEAIRIPPDALGLISMKSKVKSLGLVNVSGFHVDPGFQGRLRFSVYNAGPSPVVISRGTPIFLIWFAALDMPTLDLYKGRGGRDAFTDRDTMDMQGDVFTPHVLADRMLTFERGIEDRVGVLERTIRWRDKLWLIVLTAIITVGLTILAQTAWRASTADNSADDATRPPNAESRVPSTTPLDSKIASNEIQVNTEHEARLHWHFHQSVAP